tara:strand:- start:2604 stop:5663 length:3060 start_codon:yes stop_codon:yes gene_type:complete
MSSIIQILEKMEELMYIQSEPFKARAYNKAKETIINKVMNNTNQKTNQKTNKKTNKKTNEMILANFKEGSSVFKIISEFLETGQVQKLLLFENDPKYLFTKVYGIGPKVASKLVDLNIKTIEELRERSDVLNNVQKKGLKYYEALLERIPRSEINKYNIKLNKLFPNGDSKMQIVGSWRRQAKTSGDIDIIMSGDASDYTNFIDILIKKKVLIEVLSRGKIKTLGISQLTPSSIPRRIDFMFTGKAEFPFAVLYFTGSKIFNTLMRARAQDLGYTMNEHGLYHMVKNKKGDKITQEFADEASIFAFLGIEWREPKERIGNSFKLIDAKDNESKDNGSKDNESTDNDDNESNDDESKDDKNPKKQTKKKALKKGSRKSTRLSRKKIPNKRVNAKMNIKHFKKEGDGYLNTLSENEIEEMIQEADKYYYDKNKPLMNDEEYDILLEWSQEKFPENEVIKQGHSGITITKQKVKLPYFLGSMDKIKPDTNILNNWIKKFPGDYVVSAKLDGMSCLICYENGIKIYTRGKGDEGFDISHLAPYIKIPTLTDEVVRGELIISKENFKKYKNEYSNERSFAAGMVNGKNLDTNKLADLDFVAYEVIKPDLKPSQQYTFLKSKKFITVINKKVKNIDQDILSKYLMDWRESYDYIIDGVICIQNEKYKRKTKGNPDHAFAFKKVMGDQIGESIVVDVIWSKTQYGYVKPKIKIRPVKIGGVKITYATAHNAKFIVENSIGIGSVIQIIRSGDVIPKVYKVVKSSKEPKLPTDMNVKWNKTGVDLVLEDIENDETVKHKTILAFFQTINVDGLKKGNMTKIIGAGYDSIGKILIMRVEDFMTIAGFKQKLSEKICDSIQDRIENVSLPLLMDASNMFGRGMGENRLKMILDEYPDILTMKATSPRKREMVVEIDGFAEITAKKFVKNVNAFMKFIKENNLEFKLEYVKENIDDSHELYGKNVLMTGFRDEDFKMNLRDIGVKIASSVSSNVDILVVKSMDTTTGKMKKAQEMGIDIIIKDDFVAKYL